MKQKTMILALFGAIAFPLFVYAEIPVLDEIVVTGTRMPQSLNKTIADTTVLNEQDIRKSGAADVSRLLRSLAGVEVAQSGGLGTTSAIYMRGTNSNQVLVLLDGVRINSATTGSTALEHIMLDSIERIEVVRGNISSMYGSEAIGGVIQLFTRQGRGVPAFSASAGVGSYATQRASAGFSGNVNDTSFSTHAGTVKTDGVSAMNPLLVPKANPNKNGYDNNTFDAQIKQTLNVDHALIASVFSTRGNISLDSSAGLPTDIYGIVENIDKLSLASDDQINDLWHSQVRLAQGTDDYYYYINGVQNARYQTRSNQVAWQNTLKIAEGHSLSLSAENLNQAVTSTKVFVQTFRNVNSLLGGYVGEYGAQQVQLNLRQDRYSDFGTANTGLLGYGVSFADSWRATASVSNAFRAPTFNELFYPGFGNPGLSPERSQNREAGLHYTANGQHVNMVYFDNKISNLIVYGAAPFYLPSNINQAKIHGQALSYAGEFGATHVSASATFQNPRDGTTGAVLVRRAKQFASVAASHDFGDWNMGAEVRYSGARMDGVNVLHGYELLNLTSRYQIDKNLNLSARVDNLFNRNYSEVYGYNTLGRNLFVGLTYQQ